MTIIPPIKSQGIKTKLAGWILEKADEVKFDRWVEPFMGTGVVGFNARPASALMADTNPYLIKFYQDIQRKEITPQIARDYLEQEGAILLETNGEYYYDVRSRFNEKGDSLDFLFLSRSCFNGMMRFNRKQEFNVPFCKKPNRFAKALVTKIVNQITCVQEVILSGDFEFKCQSFTSTLEEVRPSDLIYCDPPYIGRHVDYFNSWLESDELKLHEYLNDSGCAYMVSTWLKNKYRANGFVFELWKDTFVSTREHFYHVGAKESNRNSVIEALLCNKQLAGTVPTWELSFILKEFDSIA